MSDGDMERELWDLADDPGPMVTTSGHVVINKSTGTPYPDQRVRLEALRTLLVIQRRLRESGEVA